MIKAIFFDLYETLITEWNNGTKKATNSIKLLGIPEDKFKEEWNNRVDRRMDGTFENYQSVLIDILQSQQKTCENGILERMVNERIKAKSIPFEQIDDSIIKVLHSILDLEIKIGLISNCTPEEVVAWETSRLAEFFDDVVFSFQAKCSKPNPDIYLKACKNLKVKPKEALFIGDGGSNELQGATNVGMKAFHAAWFLPEWLMKEKNFGFPQLINPIELIELIKQYFEEEQNE